MKIVEGPGCVSWEVDAGANVDADVNGMWTWMAGCWRQTRELIVAEVEIRDYQVALFCSEIGHYFLTRLWIN